MPRPQTRQEAHQKAIQDLKKKIRDVDIEWDAREDLPDIAPAEYVQIYPHHDHTSVKVGKDTYYSSIDSPGMAPTLATLRTLAVQLPCNVPLTLERRGTLSLRPELMQQKRPGEPDEKRNIAPVLLVIDPGTKGTTATVSIKWWSLRSRMMHVQVTFPLVALGSKLMRSVGRLDVRYKYLGGRVSSVEVCEFYPSKNLLRIEYPGGNVVTLQKRIKWASGDSHTANRFTLYWQQNVIGELPENFSPDYLAEVLEPEQQAKEKEPDGTPES